MPGPRLPRGGGDRAKLYLDPWPHLIVDDFLEASTLERSIVEIDDAYSFEIERRGAGQIEYSLLRSVTLWEALYSKRTIRLLSAAFGAPLALSRDNWIQVRRMNDDSPEFPPHHDFVSAESSVVSFLYLSSGWKDHHGGQLRLFRDLDDEVSESVVAPVQNRFVAFQTRGCHWHAVGKVFGWERLSALALWDVVRDSAG